MIVVGITPDHEAATEDSPHSRILLKTAYVEAVQRAGGLPVVLPVTGSGTEVEAHLDRVDAVVVTGGAFDVPPELYGEAPRSGLGALKEERTRFETLVLEGALRRDRPVLGICGGMQLLNVVYGGTLHQDILDEVPGALDHEQTHDRREPAHEVDVAEGSLLARLLGAGTSRVNTTHHQAAARIGRGLSVSARAPDGVVEAVEDPQRPYVLGVQWHPELLAGDPRQQAIYDGLVQAAREAASTHG